MPVLYFCKATDQHSCNDSCRAETRLDPQCLRKLAVRWFHQDHRHEFISGFKINLDDHPKCYATLDLTGAKASSTLMKSEGLACLDLKSDLREAQSSLLQIDKLARFSGQTGLQ